MKTIKISPIRWKVMRFYSNKVSKIVSKILFVLLLFIIGSLRPSHRYFMPMKEIITTLILFIFVGIILVIFLLPSIILEIDPKERAKDILFTILIIQLMLVILGLIFQITAFIFILMVSPILVLIYIYQKCKEKVYVVYEDSEGKEIDRYIFNLYTCYDRVDIPLFSSYSISDFMGRVVVIQFLIYFMLVTFLCFAILRVLEAKYGLGACAALLILIAVVVFALPFYFYVSGIEKNSERATIKKYLVINMDKRTIKIYNDKEEFLRDRYGMKRPKKRYEFIFPLDFLSYLL
ncbi:hypothetical protein Mfer_1153 [Methanothermus fervidus DSM 2088]|uniref:Uncharacterized protein n=1 Tax=Methanothermus fervidus (strain ATCC 43054 / DSM 2088 / JCM 10308 / V24 S) TaxID=523846 RepID=E3GWH4_METFV|nr:hypothetical protein [Methanothermus fervidus]ADP77939.1 hypothetical protein Mfer_1153 [Methanothermus fervidus DSM 2088]